MHTHWTHKFVLCVECKVLHNMHEEGGGKYLDQDLESGSAKSIIITGTTTTANVRDSGTSPFNSATVDISNASPPPESYHSLDNKSKQLPKGEAPGSAIKVKLRRQTYPARAFELTLIWSSAHANWNNTIGYLAPGIHTHFINSGSRDT